MLHCRFGAVNLCSQEAIMDIPTAALPRPRSRYRPAAAGSRPSRIRRRYRRLALQLGSVLVFLVIWQIVGMHTSPILFSTPLQVIEAFGTLIGNGQLAAVLPSAANDLFTGYILAAVVGIVVGVLIGHSSTLEAVLNPYINFAMATPLVAVIPLLVIWVGIGAEARIATVFTLTVFTVIVNTATGVKATPRVLREVALVYRLKKFRVVREITLFNAVPNIFAGLRLGLGKALIGMIIAEMEVSVTGLGGLIYNYGDEFRTADLLAGICTASLFGVVAAGLLAVIQSRAFPWVAATTELSQRG
jgi:ABC-type nitrate/sulfonate/bicarbonate transport system permease component